MSIDEFIDPALGRMVAAQATYGCSGCVYDDGGCRSPVFSPPCCAGNRADSREVIWVHAEKPAAVRLTDEQIIKLRQTTRMLPGQWGDTKAFARAIEDAVLKANGLGDQQ